MQSLTFASKTSTASQLNKKCAQNADRFHDLESTLQYFHIVEIKMLIFHYRERIVLNFLQNWKVNYLCLTTYEVNWRKKSTHNMESGKYSKNTSTMSKSDRLGRFTMEKIISKGKWHFFFTISNKADSLMTGILCMEEGNGHFSTE